MPTGAARGVSPVFRYRLLLLDSHAFGQVAGLIDSTAALIGDMVGQQLQRHHRQQGHQRLSPARTMPDRSTHVCTAIAAPAACHSR